MAASSRASRVLSAVAAALAPVSAPAAAPVVGFVPASLRLGSSGSCPASRFLVVARGALSFPVLASGLRGWDGAALVVSVGGRSFRCLASGLGGVGSDDFAGLVAALRALVASGDAVSLLGAPGSSGRVLGGFFCGVTVAPVAVVESFSGF